MITRGGGNHGKPATVHHPAPVTLIVSGERTYLKERWEGASKNTHASKRHFRYRLATSRFPWDLVPRPPRRTADPQRFAFNFAAVGIWKSMPLGSQMYNPGQNVWDKVLFPELLQYSLAPPPMQCCTTLRQAFPYEQRRMGGGGGR